jgi:hypothetical protein
MSCGKGSAEKTDMKKGAALRYQPLRHTAQNKRFGTEELGRKEGNSK